MRDRKYDDAGLTPKERFQERQSPVSYTHLDVYKRQTLGTDTVYVYRVDIAVYCRYCG